MWKTWNHGKSANPASVHSKCSKSSNNFDAWPWPLVYLLSLLRFIGFCKCTNGLEASQDLSGPFRTFQDAKSLIVHDQTYRLIMVNSFCKLSKYGLACNVLGLFRLLDLYEDSNSSMSLQARIYCKLALLAASIWVVQVKVLHHTFILHSLQVAFSKGYFWI